MSTEQIDKKNWVPAVVKIENGEFMYTEVPGDASAADKITLGEAWGNEYYNLDNFIDGNDDYKGVRDDHEICQIIHILSKEEAEFKSKYDELSHLVDPESTGPFTHYELEALIVSCVRGGYESGKIGI